MPLFSRQGSVRCQSKTGEERKRKRREGRREIAKEKRRASGRRKEKEIRAASDGQREGVKAESKKKRTEAC